MASRLLDIVFLGAVYFALFLGLVVIAALATLEQPEFPTSFTDAWATAYFFGWGVAVFFYDWLFLIARAKTPGKKIMGLKVVRADGRRLTQGQVIGRSALFGLPQSIICLGQGLVLLGCLWVIADAPRKRALHDMAAKTSVVRTR